MTNTAPTVEELRVAWSDNASIGVVRGDGSSQIWGAPSARHLLASVTKPFVAFAMWVALEERSLSIDAPVGPPGSTLRHLLAHGSGLPFEGPEPIAPPGMRRIYSNTGFDQAGVELERVTAMSWQDYVIEAVCQPLGMSETTFGASCARDGSSSALDLMRLARELLRPTLIGHETYRFVTANQLGELDGVVPGFGPQRPCPWGLGVELRGAKSPHWTAPGNSVGTFGHFGASGSFIWVDPVLKIALVGLGDRPFGDWAVDLWPRLGQAVLGTF